MPLLPVRRGARHLAISVSRPPSTFPWWITTGTRQEVAGATTTSTVGAACTAWRSSSSRSALLAYHGQQQQQQKRSASLPWLSIQLIFSSRDAPCPAMAVRLLCSVSWLADPLAMCPCAGRVPCAPLTRIPVPSHGTPLQAARRPPSSPVLTWPDFPAEPFPQPFLHPYLASMALPWISLLRSARHRKPRCSLRA